MCDRLYDRLLLNKYYEARRFAMGYKVQRLAGEPVIVVTWLHPSDPAVDWPAVCKEVDTLIGSDKRVWSIHDMRELKISLSTAIGGMVHASKSRPGSPRDPRCKNALVGSGMLWETVAKGAQKMQSGVDVYISSTLEEALEHARQIGVA